MNGRTITILGVLQTGALVFGIVITALCRKMGADSRFGMGPGFPVPGGFIMAGHFIHYGGFLAVLIVGWVIWAASSSSAVSRSRVPVSLIFISGVALLLALGLLGVICSLMAATPLVKL